MNIKFQESVDLSNNNISTVKKITSTKLKHKILVLKQVYNPLVPSAYKSLRNAKILILKLEGIIKKISYERRDYESVDEKSLS